MAVSDLSRASCFSRTPSEYMAYRPSLRAAKQAREGKILTASQWRQATLWRWMSQISVESRLPLAPSSRGSGMAAPPLHATRSTGLEGKRRWGWSQLGYSSSPYSSAT